VFVTVKLESRFHLVPSSKLGGATDISVVPAGLLNMRSLKSVAFREDKIDMINPLNHDYDALLEKLYAKGVKLYIKEYQ